MAETPKEIITETPEEIIAQTSEEITAETPDEITDETPAEIMTETSEETFYEPRVNNNKIRRGQKGGKKRGAEQHCLSRKSNCLKI